MKLKNIWLLTTFVLLTIAMSYGVSAGICTPESCSPTCEFLFPSSNNYALEDGNTTMIAMIKEGTTSGYYNVTTYTISSYHNETKNQNTSDKSLGPIIWSDLPEGTYKLDAIIFYDNESAEIQNLTATQVACSSRQFTVSTKEGQYVPPVEEVTETAVTKEGKKDSTVLYIVLFCLVALIIYKSKKK